LSLATTVVGSYPKPPEEGAPFTLRKTLHAVERGDASPEDVVHAQEDLARAVIAEQQEAGIDLITDGQVRWDDIVTPFASHMAGFEIGGLLRYFDNNVYYRRPVCTGAIEWRGPASVQAYAFAAGEASAPVKAVIPGPVTFARMSVDEHYMDHDRFVRAIARVLAQEAFELEAAGAPVIQIDEPALIDAPEDLDLAREAIGIVVGELEKTETLVCTYFGSCKRLGSDLLALPVDGFGFDLVSGHESVELIKEIGDERKVQAGVVDARNTKLETVDELRPRLERLIEATGTETVSLSPSAGLEFLPREKARAKLKRLSEVADAVGA
jgi:5-methyltetrahydropteroyltriglutamate--homocysteine methyltransferase